MRSEAEERKSRGDDWCRHRTPFDKQEHPVCKVGVDYHRFDRNNMPCLGESEAAKAGCPKYLAYTPQELADREARMNKRINDTLLARIAISKHIDESGKPAGVMECPVCSGKLHYSKSDYNGHIHGKCETAECLSWME